MYANQTAFSELGLADTAGEREIKAAWRRLVSQWHPDRNPSVDAVARMQRINRAFDAIRDAGYRNPVDWSPFVDMPEPAPAAARAQAKPSASAGSAGTPPFEAEPEPQAPPRKPISRRVRLTLEEAATGCVKVLRGKMQQSCAACEGSGQNAAPLRCTACRGAGQVRPHFFGWPGAAQACEACGGSGQIRQRCAPCQGQGHTTRTYEVKVRLPAGVRSGDRLHVASQRAGKQAPPADLDIAVEWLPHAFFTLDADGTVRCELPVDGFAWIAQREVPVPTLNGVHALPLRRDQLQYVLAGQGFPPQRGSTAQRPDQVVLLRPVFPDATSEAQNALLDQLIASTEAGAPKALQDWRRTLAAWAKNQSKDGQGKAGA
ncbi:MAG: molecular chaperone DnaJ [Comamonadaceae bacterium]|nr:MAG: molecular chaperone DnaJ [Comamonadaceae bacterium]